jgi:Zn-finger nucleic acid-binding protein
MNCPRCRHELSEVTIRGTRVDVCDGGCGGIWFDNFELQRFDEPDEAADRLLAETRVDLTARVDLQAKLSCPGCPDTALLRRPFSKAAPVYIDACPACGGVWLDYGELFQIREAGEEVLQGAPDPQQRASDLLRRFLAG